MLDQEFTSRTKPDWYVNSRVEYLEVRLEVEVADEELQILERRHPTAPRFVANGEEYHQSEQLALRLAEYICAATNAVLVQIRDSFGQDWIELVEHDSTPGNFLPRVGAQWRKALGEWRPVRLVPHSMVMRGFVLGVADQYLEPADWAGLQERLINPAVDGVGFALLVDARRRYRLGDQNTAVVQLNAGVESATLSFLEASLSGAIPPESLRSVLKQGLSRLLSDWVLPLIRLKNLPVSDQDWQAIQRIRSVRNEIAHPGAPAAGLDQVEFSRLERAARKVIATLGGVPMPKAPPYFPAGFGGGNV